MGLFGALRRGLGRERGEVAAPGDVSAGVEPGAVCAPVSGCVAALSKVPDAVFSSGMMGLGLALWPSDETVRSPVSGTVTVAMSHAVGITTDDGVELLVHVGVDTVDMRGHGLEVLVRQGERVRLGQPCVRMDRGQIAAAGHPDCVIVVVTNVDACGQVEVVASPGASVAAGDEVLRVSP